MNKVEIARFISGHVTFTFFEGGLYRCDHWAYDEADVEWRLNEYGKLEFLSLEKLWVEFPDYEFKMARDIKEILDRRFEQIVLESPVER